MPVSGEQARTEPPSRGSVFLRVGLAGLAGMECPCTDEAEGLAGMECPCTDEAEGLAGMDCPCTGQRGTRDGIAGKKRRETITAPLTGLAGIKCPCNGQRGTRDGIAGNKRREPRTAPTKKMEPRTK